MSYLQKQKQNKTKQRSFAAMKIKNKTWFMSLVLILGLLSLKPSLCNGADTITANQSLTGDQTIVSAGGVFKLGFFKPGNNNSSNNNYYYIGIWYNKLPEKTIVWVANRDAPISDTFSSQLKILNGNLVLLNEFNTPIWSTDMNSSATSNNFVTTAVLEDSGNLVVVLGGHGSNSSEPIWQSFDHPTDTWLPGCKIGLNRRTLSNKRLVSWKNTEDPAPGLFSLQHDPNGIEQYILLWNASYMYWNTGPWDGQSFSSTPELRYASYHDFKLVYVSNENESYFVYTISNTSVLSRFVMDVSGQVKQLTWLDSTNNWNLFWSQPGKQCEVTALCGAFSSCNEEYSPMFCNCLMGYQPKSKKDWDLNDHSSGCVRETPLTCGNSSTSDEDDRDKFLASPSMKLPGNAQFVAVKSRKECELTCLGSCSCSAYAYDSSKCSVWIGDLLNIKQLSSDDSTGKTLYIKLAASEFPNSNSISGTVLISVAVGSVAGFVVLLGLVLFYVLRRRRRTIGAAEAVEGSLVAFGYKDLKNATKNFSERLGGGGFGSVFKGTLPDSTVIAVKKLGSISQGEKQFRTEVSTIGAIQHVNLVRLRGFCSEGTKKLLVYDYMVNGSLDANLFFEKSLKVLDWKTRCQIALGIARGLVYLHENCRDCIIHCDIKPENILLDADFCPKVADFGLAKLLGREFSRVLTTMRGTKGYLAPEWISGLAITAKADVYSYGMMLFELVSGRRNSELSENGEVKFFPTYAARKIIEGDDNIGLLDLRLEENADVEEVTRVCRVACWCIQDVEAHRPSMSQVVQMLEGVLDVKLPPIPRSLQMLVDNQEHIIFFTEPSSGRIARARSKSSTAHE